MDLAIVVTAVTSVLSTLAVVKLIEDHTKPAPLEKRTAILIMHDKTFRIVPAEYREATKCWVARWGHADISDTILHNKGRANSIGNMVLCWLPNTGWNGDEFAN